MPSLRSHTHGRHLPHVLYAVLRTWDLVAVSAAVAGLGAVAPVELTFDGVGLFRRGRAWLLAGASAEFLTWQERVVDVVTATGAELHKHYRPGRWVPHCSVAPRAPLAQLPVLVSALYEMGRDRAVRGAATVPGTEGSPCRSGWHHRLRVCTRCTPGRAPARRH